MQLLNLTLPKPEANLALDDALVEEAEATGDERELLRLWEPPRPFVVVGRSSRIAAEVNEAACRQQEIAVLRRSSGGAAVVAGPGCLMYSLLFSLEARPELRAIDSAHRFVLGMMAKALERLVPGIAQRGTSDLTLADRKFSGNSLRVKRDHILYHGTLLYDLPLDLIETLLALPSRQPEYRQGRSHWAFLTNLPVSGPQLRQAVADAWSAHEPRADWPAERTARLVAEKYSTRDWNYRY